MNKRSSFIMEMVFVLFLLFVGFLLGYVTGQYKGSAIERISPADRISSEQLSYSNDYVCVHYKNLTVNEPAGTNSMDPLIDNGTHTIHYIPQNETEVRVGDIVSYWVGDGLIIHRVIEIKNGSFQAKGDNNKVKDPWMPLSSIESILIGIIY